MRIFRTITARALKPGPKPDPALRAQNPKWFRRGRAVNGPENYDPLERRFFFGRPARALSECAKDQAALAQGKIRSGAGTRFVSMSCGFITALWTYMRVKRALYLICCPFRAKATHTSTGRDRPATPRPARTRTWRQPTAKDWAALDRTYGFDVRMTSPDCVIARARRLRRLVWDAPHSKPETKAPRRQSTPKAATPVFPAREPDDLFAIWPPVALPNLPRSTRRRAAPALAALREELYATPQPRALSLMSLNSAYDVTVSDLDVYELTAKDVTADAPFGANLKARASPAIRGP